jgi:hypothetical protein
VRFLCTFAILCACDGDGAAVDVRWLIVDLTTGSLTEPNSAAVEHSNGSCGVIEPDAAALPTWGIEKVRLVLANPVTNEEVQFGDGCSNRLLFNCNQREAITPFSLPLGNFALSIRAVNGCVDDPSVVTPAPSVRMLKVAEVVDLNVQELGIHPVPLASFDGGVADLAAPDAGPVP